MKTRPIFAALLAAFIPLANFSTAATASPDTSSFPPKMQSVPLYGDAAIPNSKAGPDEESSTNGSWIKNVSRPVIQVYLPAKARATGAGIVIFPGGGYAGLTFDFEGTQQANFFIDHGIAAVDVDNSILFFEALRHAGVPVETRLFQAGEHGFFLMPRDRWQAAIMDWLASSGWLSTRAN